MLKEALDLAGHGLAIHWLHPKSKRPIGNDWQSKKVQGAEELKASYRDGNNVGIRLGKWSMIGGYYLHVIDADIRVSEAKNEAFRRLAELLPELDLDASPKVKSGSGGDSLHILVFSDKPFPAKKFAHSTSFKMVWDADKGRDVKKWDWELHLLGTGTQVAAPPSIHPVTGAPYKWITEIDWDDLDMGIAHTISSDAMERLIGYEEGEALDPERMQPIGISLTEAHSILSWLSFDAWFDDRDGWLRVGMALKHEFGSESDEAYKLWCEFSGKSEKFDLKDSLRVWKSIKNRQSGRPFRMASLRSEAKYNEWLNTSVDITFDDLEDDFEDQPDDDLDELLGGSAELPKPTRSQVKLAKEKVEIALGRGVPKNIRRLNEKHAIARVSSKTVVMDFHADGSVTYGNVSDIHSFYEFDRVASEKSTMPVSKQWIQHPQRRTYPNGIVFTPNKEVEGAYNHWQGFSVAPSESSRPERGCKLFLRHLLDVVCCGNEDHYRYHLGWLAHMVQRPEDKPGVAVVYKGRKRIGKDTVFEYFGRLIQNHYITIANQDQLLGKFNAHQEKCLLLHVQEGFWAGSKQGEAVLKYLITSPDMLIEPKGMNAFRVLSVLRLFISSNERWVIPATEDEGRFFVLNVSEKRRNDHAYFAALREEMNGDGPSCLLAYLMTFDISNFQVRAVPDTEALAEQKVQGLKNVERWWLDTLQRAQIDGIQNRDDGVDSAVWMSREVGIDKNEFRDNYSRWMRSRRYDGEEVSEIEFGIRMRKLCPSATSKQVKRSGRRFMIYTVPYLEQCRKEFEQFLGSEIAWPDDQLNVDLIDEEEDDL